MKLKNLSIGLILLGGFGLIFIQQNTVLWYVGLAIVILGFILMTVSDKRMKK